MRQHGKIVDVDHKRLVDRFEFVYTPEHGSWLNAAEIELSVLQGQCLNRRLDSEAEVRAWLADRNHREAVINWHFQAEDAQIRLTRLYPTF